MNSGTMMVCSWISGRISGGVRERRILIFLLVVLLIVPVLLVPVSASSDVWYNYDGKLFPQVPYVDPVKYPYQMIVQSWVGWYIFVATDTLPYVKEWRAGDYGVYFENGLVFRCNYDSTAYSWDPLLDSTGSSSNNISLYEPFYIWSSFDLYNGSQLFNAASAPVLVSLPQYPAFVTNLFANKVYTYDLNQEPEDLLVSASGASGESLVYQWQSYENGSWINAVNSNADPRYFTPSTSVQGSFKYRCLVFYASYGPASGSVSNSVYVVVGSATPAGDGIGAGEQVIIDQMQGVQNAIDDVKDSIEDLNDSINATSPDLDASIQDAEDSSGLIGDFENQQWNDINDNIDSVTGAFDVFGDGSLAAAFGFVGGIVNNTFDSLGNWQVVLTLPLALGLILYICSRAPLQTIPRAGDRAARDVERAKRQNNSSGGGKHAVGS